MSEPIRVGILISGRGSNMVALVDAMQRGGMPAIPAVVLSNRPDAAGLERAKALGVPTEIVDHSIVKPREAHERAVVETLRRYHIQKSTPMMGWRTRVRFPRFLQNMI